MSAQERRNNRIGVLTSVGVHAALFLAFFFLMAWRAPNPPLAEYGIELNFGLDDQGSGDIQPETPVGEETEKVAEETKQAEPETEAIKSEDKEEVEEVPEKAVEQAVSKVESPVIVKEEKKESKADVVKPSDAKPTEKLEAVYKKDEKKVTDPAATAKKGEAGSHGDDSKKAGDKGNPEGTLDAKALYGTPGGGGGGDGMNLDMTGWAWATKPQIPDLPDNENGKVIFEIECDSDGEIVGIKTIERTLSPRAEQMLKEEISKHALVKESGGPAPPRSKGIVVFRLRTK